MVGTSAPALILITDIWYNIYHQRFEKGEPIAMYK